MPLRQSVFGLSVIDKRDCKRRLSAIQPRLRRRVIGINGSRGGNGSSGSLTTAKTSSTPGRLSVVDPLLTPIHHCHCPQLIAQVLLIAGCNWKLSQQRLFHTEHAMASVSRYYVSPEGGGGTGNAKDGEKARARPTTARESDTTYTSRLILRTAVYVHIKLNRYAEPILDNTVTRRSGPVAVSWRLVERAHGRDRRGTSDTRCGHQGRGKQPQEKL
ncbi:hypothetical protein J6590_037322 [Homalodisca vitripennis]|nr:hypothetical protein J6590_037322 [Homalodisca vitripennis]